MPSNFRRHHALDRALLILLCLGVAGNLWAMRVAQGRAYTMPPPTPLPLDFAGWKGEKEPDDIGAQAILPHARIDGVRYERSDSMPIEFIVIASRDPNDMHTPERCIVGSGFEIVSDETRPITVPGADGGIWMMHRLLIQKSDAQELIFYGYDGLKTIGGSTLMARVAMKLGGSLKKPAYFVRFASPTNGDIEGTEKRLLTFATDMLRARKTWQPAAPAAAESGKS